MKIFLSCLASYLLVFQTTAKPPNVVFILADDLGIMDINAFATHFSGEKTDELYYETPHLNQLVADGISFSQSYANQLCSPTRAAILSGRIASRLGFTTATPNTRTYYNQGMEVPEHCSPHDAFGHKDRINAPRSWNNAHSNTALDPEIPTLPQVLKTHESTFMGKWHLGGHGVAHLQPAAHGFRELPFFDAGGSPYFKWRGIWNNKKKRFATMPGKFRVGKAGPTTDHDYLTDDLSARACQFLREQAGSPNDTKPFLLYFCPFAVHTPLQAPAKTIAHFENKPQRGKLGHHNPIYAAMVKKLDDSIGDIRRTLRETGLAEETIFIFTSDNGGVEYTKPAATDNQPFKGGKACLYEGGVRVPTIVHWPGHFEGGIWCDQVIDATDFLPTLAELTGNQIPADIDGRSAVPFLQKPERSSSPRTLYWHYPYNVMVKHPDHGTPLNPHSAIRVGDHKLIWDWHGRLELYHIPDDPYEADDLSKKNPQLTASLHTQLKSWLKENVAPPYFPKLNPHFDPNYSPQDFPFKDLR